MRVTAAQFRNMARSSGDARRTLPALQAADPPAACDVPRLAALADPSDGAAFSGFVVELEAPPSLNNAFVNVAGKGRVASARYKAWRRAAGLELMAARLPRLHGSYGLVILLPVETRGDIDNRIKPVADVLVAHGLVTDDRYCDCVMVRRSTGVAAGRCIVSVRPSPDISGSPASVDVGCGPKPPSILPPVDGG